MKTVPPLKTPWGEIEATLPRESRRNAQETARKMPHPQHMNVRFDALMGGMDLKVPMGERIFFDLYQRMVISREIYETNAVGRAIYLFEDLDIDRKDGFLMRIVRRCKPNVQTPLRYDLFDFTFMVRKGLLTIVYDGEELESRPDGEMRIDEVKQFVELFDQTDNCIIVLGSHPLAVGHLFHNDTIHKKEHPAVVPVWY